MGNSSDTNESQPSETASSEVDRYHTETPLTLACKNPNFCQNPLTWLEMRATQYVNLSELARKSCAFLFISVPSERIFSVTGNIINENRSRHIPANVDKLIFLYKSMS